MKAIGLYDPSFERDSCGVGFVANISGQRNHDVLQKAIQAVVNLTHRGAIAGDAKTGDGAGILTQIPQKLFAREAAKLAGERGTRFKPGDMAVGMFFLPREKELADRCRKIVQEEAAEEKLVWLGWRPVPVDPSVLGNHARASQPEIVQALLARPETISVEEYERLLYLVRNSIEQKILHLGVEGFYIPSFSNHTLVYKGLFVASQLKKFFLDLSDPLYETAIAVFHQRYSTNTMPNWFMAQPFRFLGHNGEINTLMGNRNWMRAREPELHSEAWGERIERLKPIVQPGGSDSASLDNVMETLVMSGRDLLHAAMMLVPEPWENMPHMNPTHRAFYQYHSCIMEPWDGPAALAFSDGRIVAACLDRNGLRPARYLITKDGLVVMASEAGVLELEEGEIVEKGKLGPGRVIAIDTTKGKFYRDQEIKDFYAARNPYSDWVRRQMHTLSFHMMEPQPNGKPLDLGALKQKQAAFGYTQEEISMVLKPMAADGKEPVGSMGDDTPHAVLSKKPRLLYTYFKQMFAQVTNPPIDSLREEIVMSLYTLLGQRRSCFEETEQHARLLQLTSPVLTDLELESIRQLKDKEFASATLETLFPVTDGVEGLEKAVRRLCRQASLAIDQGKRIIILSDQGADRQLIHIPDLLAVGAVHHHLIREGKRMKVSLLCETAEARDVHHVALLIGYGASAVNPYLAYEIIRALVETGEFKDLDLPKGLKNYKKALEEGILKIMSKMGISTVSSYHGAQIFEAIGLDTQLVNDCFTGTSSRVSGIRYAEIAADLFKWHKTAFPGDGSNSTLEAGGYYRFRKEGEYHAFNPDVIRFLHAAVESGQWEDYQKFADTVNHREPVTLRDLMDFAPGKPIPIDEVEPIEEIRKKFCVSGMSHGALSRETHETLAMAMNRIKGKSSSGEGGEDPSRYHVIKNGDSPNSVIKQVASGRFGVTPEYLASAIQFEIKMAQGSKPGEGGQLPGYKVTQEIAANRHTVPGVALISPPPHHDIYSIEDLAQLIYDLKTSNARATVCVKLVSEAGVGTIAAGVAKGHADTILISGHDGGTGASPLSSIKYAGSAWELGLSEAQQVLVLNDLRGRVRLRADGGQKTGRDVVIAAILGAEEYGFGTAPVVAAGCCMVRQCHLNTCPVGVATQDEKLRAKYDGPVEHVVHYFNFVAREIREILAQLGFRKLDDIVGHTGLLTRKPEEYFKDHPKAAKLDLSKILTQVDPEHKRPWKHTQERNDRDEVPFDNWLIQHGQAALAGLGQVRLESPIRNTNRAVGTRLSGEIARRYGNAGLPDGTIEVKFRGSAGQSFGAFLIRGVRLILEGEANDYVGKGMAGGELIIYPPRESRFDWRQNVIIGNTVMYGATGGILYAAGRAGERFCVRNSGGRAVVEGLGDHGCEYMTGGIVVVLGKVGRNFGAGMTGGMAFILDEEGGLPNLYNPQLVQLEQVESEKDVETLQGMIAQHAEYTGSLFAKEILLRRTHYLPYFRKVVPKAQVARIEAAVGAMKK